MSTVTWGELPKSQIDNQKISEAIADAIDSHNDDSAAHQSSGQSLKSHKAESVIDHPAGSVIEDKVKDNVVSVPKQKWDQFTWKTIFESLDAWTQTTTGTASITHYLGSVEFKTGVTASSVAKIVADSFSEGWGVNFSKNPRFMSQVNLDAVDNQRIYVFAGNEFCAFGFEVVGDILRAFHRKDVSGSPTRYITNILTLSGSNVWYKLEAIYISGSRIEFYVDGVLKATHDSNLPEDGDNPDCIEFFTFSIKNEAAVSRNMYIRNLNFTQNE